MHVRHRLDASLGDVLFGLAACAGLWRRGRLAARVLAKCRAERDGIVCLSVRTGWDLWLGASGFLEGDEVLLSAVTHPEMARIARLHGLRVVPVDLDPETLVPRPGSLEAALSPRARVMVVAHLFGGRVDLGHLARFCEENGLLLVEDCAQAFAGAVEIGHPSVDASMYSFGTLKTATAFGGAVMRVRDATVLAQMRKTEAGYPTQGRREYAGRLLKGIFLVVVSRSRVYGGVVWAVAQLGLDLDAVLQSATKSHPDGASVAELGRRVRRRPSEPLLALLRRRLERFDPHKLVARAAAGKRLADALGPRIVRPGAGRSGATNWLFPVLVREPKALIEGLRRRGFDASQVTSSIVALRASDGAPEPVEAVGMLAGTVFLPSHAGLSGADLDRLAGAVEELVSAERSAGEAPA